MLGRLLGVAAVVGTFAVSASAATNPLLGSYTTKLSGAPVAILNATWKVEFRANGHYVISRNGAGVVAGLSHGIDGLAGGKAQVGLTDTSGPASCPGTSANGTYAWSFKKDAAKHVYLVLKAERDSCTGRKAVLTTLPLLKIK